MGAMGGEYNGRNGRGGVMRRLGGGVMGGMGGGCNRRWCNGRGARGIHFLTSVKDEKI